MDSPVTVNARPISFAEIEHLAASRQAQDAYHLTEIGTLTPATVEVTSRPRSPEKKGRNSRDYYAAVVDEKKSEQEGRTIYKPDVTRGPIGEYVKVDVRDIFGLIHGGGMFTNAEVEEATVLLEQMQDPAATRRRLYVPDSNAEPVPLTPVYGSMLTFSGVVADIDPDELAQRAERVLRAEFGPALGRNVKVLTRPVEDRRVDVSDPTTGKTLALGILAAEVHFANRVGNAVTVTDSDPNVIVG